MKIKNGLFALSVILVLLNLLVLLIGLLSYLFGFEKSSINTLIFIGIMCGTILFTVIIYLLASTFTKTYFIITENEIVYYKKNIEQYRVLVKDIIYAEYLCISFHTILNQCAIGFLDVHTNSRVVYIDMPRKKAEKINKTYFKIKFIKD